MRLRVQPTAGETLRACAAFASATLTPSLNAFFTLAVLALLGAIAFLIARPTWLVTFCLVVVGIQAVLFIFRYEERWQSRQALAADPHADESYEVEIGSEGVRVCCDHVDTRYTWDGITRVVETPEFYLFVRGASGGTWLAKRLLDVTGNEELREMICKWSPDRGASLTGIEGNTSEAS